MVSVESDLTAAFEELKKGNVNWVLSTYTDDKMTAVKLEGSGTGGYDEFITKFDNNQIMYGLFQVSTVYDEDSTSHPSKLVFVSWIGSGVKPARRGKVTMHSPVVQQKLSGFAANFQISSLDAMQKSDVEQKLNASQGSHKPKFYKYI